MNNRKIAGSFVVNLILLLVVSAVMLALVLSVRPRPSDKPLLDSPTTSVVVDGAASPVPETPAPTDPAPYPGPLTPPPVFTPAPTWDVNFHPTMPPATPKPITYSIDSAEKWMTYVNPELGLSLKYPETPPRVDQDPKGGSVLNLFVRTGPTLPANPSNVAVIIIAVYPNLNQLPLNEAIHQIGTGYGEINLQDKTDSLVTALSSKAGVAAAGIVETGWGPLYAVAHGQWLYIIGGAVTTESDGQRQVLELVISTLEFTDEK